jgi:hypothetical protein
MKNNELFDSSKPVVMVSFVESVKFFSVGKEENKLIKTFTFDKEVLGIDCNSTTFVVVSFYLI